MKETLAIKWRPKTFDEVIGQDIVVKILKRQVDRQEFKNVYLFSGATGCGKTTIARIFANNINKGLGRPIEIDGASNNGVDNVRNIIDGASQRALDSEYKVYIIDEAHMLTIQAWNAFLKCIEEPPAYTIFMFCSTNVEKFPATILNRVQQFNLTRISPDLIANHLKNISRAEGFYSYEDSCEYISNHCKGGMRDALSMLDKVIQYSEQLSVEKTIQILGGFEYKDLFNITNAIIDKRQEIVFNTINKCFNSGLDMNQFIDDYLNFCIDLSSYCLFKDMSTISIPVTYEKEVRYVTGADEGNQVKFFNGLTTKILDIKTAIFKDPNPKITILAMMTEMFK